MYTKDPIHLLFFLNFWLNVEYLKTRFVLRCKCRAVLRSEHVSDVDVCCRISAVASYWFFTCSTLLCLSLQYTRSVSHVDSDGSRLHSFCNLKWRPAVLPSSISLQMKRVETGEEMWFYPVWVRCAVYGDLFGCLTADFLPFPMPDFIPIFIPSAMGLLWLAHFLLPVLSWMCHLYWSALASTWIQCCHVYPSRITPTSSVMASEKLF